MQATDSGSAAALEARRTAADALIELSRAVHKIGMYPPGHPLVPAAVGRVREALGAALGTRAALRFGVGKDRILLEDEPLDEKNHVLQGLARALHGAGVSVLEFAPALSNEGLGRLIGWIYRIKRSEADVEADETLQSSAQGIRLEWVDYARLSFSERSTDRADAVWDALAGALLRGLPGGPAFLSSGAVPKLAVPEEPLPAAPLGPHGRGTPRRSGPGANPAGGAVAPETIAERIGEAMLSRRGEESAAHGEVLACELAALGRRLTGLPRTVREEIKRRIATLVSHLSPDLRRQLLRVTPAMSDDRVVFLSEIAEALPEKIVLEVLDEVDLSGAKVPHQVITLLNKMNALSGDRRRAFGESEDAAVEPVACSEEQMRGVLREVFTDRGRADHGRNPAAYQHLLEAISGGRTEAREAPAGMVLPAHFRDARDPIVLRAEAAWIASRLVLDGSGVSAGSDLDALLGYIRGAIDEGLRGHQWLMVRDAVLAARHVLQFRPEVEAACAAANEILDCLRSPDAVDVLIDASEHEVADTVLVLGELFAVSGAQGVRRALTILPSHPPGRGRDRRVQFLASADSAALMEGYDLIAGDGLEALRGAVPLLRRLPTREAIEIARKLTGHPDAGIRIEAYRTLASVDRREGAFDRNLESALWDADPEVVVFALGLLKGRAGEGSCRLLSRYLAGQVGLASQTLKMSAVRALSELPLPAARDALVKVLLSGSWTFRADELGLRVEAERALLKRSDAASARALRRWQRSLAYWTSLIVVRRSG